MRIVNRPIVSVPSRFQLKRHASGSCDVSYVHQTVRSWLAVTAVFTAPVYNPSEGLCFLPVVSNVVRMSLHERARAWACTCVSHPSETAALLMAVCFCILREDVMFPVSRDGNIKEIWAAVDALRKCWNGKQSVIKKKKAERLRGWISDTGCILYPKTSVSCVKSLEYLNDRNLILYCIQKLCFLA